MSERNPTDTVQLKLRLREDLRLKIEERAKLSSKSINSEIVSMLEESLKSESFMSIVKAAEETIDKKIKVYEDNLSKLMFLSTEEYKKIEEIGILGTIITKSIDTLKDSTGKSADLIGFDPVATLMFVTILVASISKTDDVAEQYYNFAINAENPIAKNVSIALFNASVDRLKQDLNKMESLKGNLDKIDTFFDVRGTKDT